MPVEAPSWLNSGDTAWQITAATLVGLMSVPGLAVLYGGVMQKRWSINSMMLTFATFSIVLVVWVLWGFKMGFGSPFHGLSHSGFFGNFIGKPGPVLSHTELQHQANIPNDRELSRSRTRRSSTSSSCSPRSRRSWPLARSSGG